MVNNTLLRRNTMWQIKVNEILMPTIYWSYRDALDASYIEKARGCAVVIDIVYVGQNS